MTIEQALEYVHGTLRFGSKPGLDAIECLLEKLGDPQNDLKFIHVAGTNGKGSTCSFISSVLRAAGYKTGLYISPYIEVFNERIQINGRYIPDDDIAGAVKSIKAKVDEMIREGKRSPTEFELVTAIALLYFKKENCDFVVWETGLGGRLDATNVVNTTICSAITNIGYDHTGILGDTLEEIAFEKAGIIKKDTDVVLYRQKESVMNVIRNACVEKNGVLTIADFDDIRVVSETLEGFVFNKGHMDNLNISLLGEHQLKNVSVALEVCEILKKQGVLISDNAIRLGLKNTRWPGRAQIIRRDPYVLIDGGHNIQCAEALKALLDKYFPGKAPIFLYGSLKDKDYFGVSKLLFTDAKAVITVSTEGDRGLSGEELAETVKLHCKSVFSHDTIKMAVAECKRLAETIDVIVVFGSLTFLWPIKKEMEKQF